MKIWAIADLHLSFGVKEKEMDVFGPKWVKHHEKIRQHWLECISENDLVLIAGDLSWALNLEHALPDLMWIAALPGTKVIIKGNHDLWWKTTKKVRDALPPSMHLIYNDACTIGDVTIGGTRLWENREINWNEHIEFTATPKGVNVHKKIYTEEEIQHDEKVYKNEIERLCVSLDAMSRSAQIRIVMVHYPPTGPDHLPTEVTRLMHNEKIDYCIYGHLHNLKKDAPTDFQMNHTQYCCTACDHLDFIPRKLL